MGASGDTANNEATAEISARTAWLKQRYGLVAHEEGGWFAEVFASDAQVGNRAAAGSIFFLLDAGEVSRFHRLDCQEVWYYHEGCGLRITMLDDAGRREVYLGVGGSDDACLAAETPDKTEASANAAPGEAEDPGCAQRGGAKGAQEPDPCCAMVVMPAGVAFAAENVQPGGYTFVSCVTVPAFSYEGFHLLTADQLRIAYPAYADDLARLAHGE